MAAQNREKSPRSLRVSFEYRVVNSQIKVKTDNKPTTKMINFANTEHTRLSSGTRVYIAIALGSFEMFVPSLAHDFNL